MKFFVALALVLTTPAQASSLAVKDFRQILEFFTQGTGVDPLTPSINAYYGQAVTRLPKEGTVDEVNPTMILSFVSLASLFCDKLIASDAALAPASRVAHKTVDFTQGPAALSSAVRQSVIEEYAGIFWLRSPSQLELSELGNVFDGASDGAAATPDETRGVLLSVCTSAASTTDAMVN